MLAYATAGLGALSLGLVVHAGGSVFRMLLMATFTYLSFQAIRNINLFGLVAGAVLGWNVSEWIAKLAVGRPHRHRGTGSSGGWSLDSSHSGRSASSPTAITALMGDNIHFGLRERPLTFGHAAARFAGRPGLPRRALVFDLGQTGVYVYHNGPDRKVFMDARLEVPSRSTFQTYVRIEEWLNHNDPRWDAAIARLGDPLVLISHDGWAEAEAALLSHPRWRCIYFDEIASVFVTRDGAVVVAHFPGSRFPGFAFRQESKAPSSVVLRTTTAEASALLRLSHALRKRTGDPWRGRIPILTRAADLTWAVVSGTGVDSAPWWRQLGLIHWEAIPDLTRPPPGPGDAWDPATGLSWARASYCFRRALEAKPDDEPALRSLAECFGVRGMTDARREIEHVLSQKRLDGFSLNLGKHPAAPGVLTWSAADQLAVNYLHLGEPEAARRVWSQAAAPSPALRLTRLAESDLAALDARAAATRSQAALDFDPTLGEAWYVLAIAAFGSGRAQAAQAACREGAKHDLTPAQREALVGLDRLLSRHSLADHR